MFQISLTFAVISLALAGVALIFGLAWLIEYLLHR